MRNLQLIDVPFRSFSAFQLFRIGDALAMRNTHAETPDTVRLLLRSLKQDYSAVRRRDIICARIWEWPRRNTTLSK